MAHSPAATAITAWTPGVPGIREVLHARFGDHAYPMHSHDAWTVLMIDAGAVRYDLGRHEHGAVPGPVVLLPPDVPHNGQAVRADGFRKRVLYLERDVLGDDVIGRAVGQPQLRDPLLRNRIDGLHRALAERHESLESASRLALIAERLRSHLVDDAERAAEHDPRRSARLARELRELLDANVVDGLALDVASSQLGAAAAVLVRAFTGEFGVPPHRYLVTRRIDLARRHLLAGAAPAEAAALSGFYDQSHLDRHFRRLLGTTSARFAAQPSRDHANLPRPPARPGEFA